MQRRYRKPKPRKDPFKKFKINHQITAPHLLVIGPQGEKFGVLSLKDALEKAQSYELDLVEVYPLADPPVAKIIDYGQYKYETEKKLRKTRAHQKVAELKSIRLSFRIKGKDLETKAKQATKFLENGHKVKIDIILRGREKAHKDIAVENMKEFIASLGENIKTIQPVSVQGGQISATITKN